MLVTKLLTVAILAVWEITCFHVFCGIERMLHFPAMRHVQVWS
jgi:hypothetical protein